MKFAAILFLAVFLRLVNLNQSFWLDEAAQVIESARQLSQQLNIVSDFHPPLYHLILHFWLILGKSEVWARLPSVFFGVGSVFLIYRLGKVLFTSNAGLLSALFLAVSPYHVWYSQEARPYMLFVFVSLLSTYFLVKSNWKLYKVAIILSLYSLYFAPFLILGHFVYVYLTQKNQLKNFIKSVIISTLFFLPWVPSFLEQLKVGSGGFFTGWQNVVSVSPIKLLPLTFAKFIYGRGTIENNIIYSAILLPELLVFLISLYKIFRFKNKPEILTFFFMPLISAFLISFIIPVTAPQRLIFLLPFYCLILGIGITKLSGVKRILCIVIIVVISILGIYDYYTNPYVQREQWREAIDFTENDGGTLALFVFPDSFAPYLWYQKNKIEGIGIAPKFRIEREDLERLEQKITSHQKVYLFQYLTGLTDPDRQTWEFLEQKGYSETSIRDFPGVGFIYVFEK